MVTYDEYLKKILKQIIDSYNHLNQLKDKPGDLDVIKVELLKISGFFQVLTNKVEQKNYSHIDLLGLQSKMQNFLENYYFERELEIMAPLYGNDPNRLKNIRIKILEGLNDKKLMDMIDNTYKKL